MSRSWKTTLRLPRSSFPARPNPSLLRQHLRQCTDDLYQWQASHRPREDPFVLHDGPPYANGPLHIGHAINKILKDVILRAQIQNGRRVVYRPGWDCHGLPIELKALKSNLAQGMSPAKVRESARRLATKTITDQMKGFQSFGVMADWQSKWTTMDRDYEIKQLRVFQKMVRHGLIYRKYKPVYWSISSRTALAEAELEYRDDHISESAYVKFPILPGNRLSSELRGLGIPLYATVWTTTPWTLPANSAIAVHENLTYSVLRLHDHGLLVADNRVNSLKEVLPPFEVVLHSVPGSQLTGLEYRNKLRGKGAPAQPIVHADFVSAESGTGLVHMAPGHGQEDYDACSRLGIEAFAPIDDAGHFTEDAFPDQPEALQSAPSILEGGSQAVLKLLGQDVLGTHQVHHKYPYDWRTKQPVVLRATAQWFADVESIKAAALKASSHVNYVPSSGRSRLESFIKGRTEWCISRQRSWGVPIPALYDEAGRPVMTEESIEHIIAVMQQRSSDAWFTDKADDPAWVAPMLKGHFRRGTDTMDVWFDSGSSWTENTVQADVYLEGSDQHRGWFQSSLLTFVADQSSDGKAVQDITAPFKTLITHGFTLDAEGRKMSKSVGNTIVPDDVMSGRLLPPLKAKAGKESGDSRMDSLGPDALRLWAASSDYSSDILIGPSILQAVHNALVKYRTILKMIIGSLHPSGRRAPLTALDQIALMQLSDVMKESRKAFDQFEFHRAVNMINRWVATDLSAFYLEALKDRLYCGDGGGALEAMFIGILRMLAPITPVLVEEAWSHRPSWMADDSLLEIPSRQLYTSPVIDPSRLTLDPDKLRRDFGILSAVQDAVKAGLEKAREGKVLGSSLQCSVMVETEDEGIGAILEEYGPELETMWVVSHVEVNKPLPKSPLWQFSKGFEVERIARGAVHVLPPLQEKCSRCWQYKAEEEGGLCSRCEAAVRVAGGGS